MMANVFPSVLESYFLTIASWNFLLSLIIYEAHFCGKGCAAGLLVYRKDVVGGASQNLDVHSAHEKSI